MTLDFAEPGSRQCIERDRVIGNALMTRQSLRSRFDRRADSVLCVVTAIRLLGHDQRDEFAFFREHADLAGRGFLGISRLDIFGLNLFSTFGFDQCRDATEDAKMIVVIEITHVAGAEPSVVRKDLFRLVLEIPIASKNIRTARDNFADLMPVDALFFFECARIDPNLYVVKRFPDAVPPPFTRQIHREQRRGLGQTVADCDPPAERFEFRSQFGVERRAAGSEKPKVFAEIFVQRTKQKLPHGQAEPGSHKSARGKEYDEQSARDPPGRFYSRFDARIERAVKPRHADDRGHLAFAQGA